MTRLWGGRFESEPAPEMMAFTQSLSFDHRLALQDCAVLGAHARALARAAVLSPDDADEISAALEAIAADIKAGSFVYDASDEDVHTAIERALLARAPDAGARVRAGLSRNDRVATAVRLWLRAEGKAVATLLAGLIETLAARAAEHRETIMPGYTHLQRAQPVTLAHHLLAHAFALERDACRILDALDRADTSPLGSGALAGTTLDLDAGETARALGFREAALNSIDAVAARDFVAEFLAAAAILGVHLSRIGEEVVLWTTEEFGFASLDDAYATGSSLMPQKKNPDVAELARGKAGRLIGNLTGLLVTLKGLPLAYNRDLQEDKEPLFDSVETLVVALPALEGLMRTMRFNAEALARAAEGSAVLATDLAEDLVRRGVPFRDAHEAVGAAVMAAEARSRPLSGLTADELGTVSHAAGTDVGEVLDAAASVARRRAPGPSPASTNDQLAVLAKAVGEIRRRST